MAEDAFKFVGFRFFETDDGLFIANEAAVRATANRLFNETAYDNAFEHLGNAKAAVGAAAEKKFARDFDRQDPPDNPNDNPDGPSFTEGFDFFV